MQFTPKSDDELAEENLLLEGEYLAEVLEAEELKSKAGKDMVKLKLKVWDTSGNTQHVYDYISPAFMHHKFKHFCMGAGLGSIYETGNLDAGDCVRQNVTAKIGVEKQDGYLPKNRVVDYLVSETATPSGNGGQPKKDDDDDLPF